jgi:hypothetical protein
MMPSTHLMVTDLPLPEPPIMTRDSPLATEKSIPSSTTLGPKRLLDALKDNFRLTVVFPLDHRWPYFSKKIEVST